MDSQLLKPFRIRELRDDDTTVGESGSSTRRDGVVQVSGPDYDSAIEKHPEAILMYMDDDDGEVITVGSAFELGQRLEEPYKLRSSRRAARNALRHGILTPPSISTMHIFDINRTHTALDVWKNFEMQDRGFSAALHKLDEKAQSEKAETSKQPETDLKVHVDASDDAARLKELEDERQRWFWACNPPRVVPVQAHAPDTARLSSIPVTKTDTVSAPEKTVSLGFSSLTSEAIKQAEDAGAKFRGWKTPAISDADISSNLLKSAHQNRWASYGQDTSFGSPDARILSTRPGDKSMEMKQAPRPTPSIPISSLIAPEPEIKAPPPIPDRPQLSAVPRDSDPPFLEVFEAEMAKMLASVTEQGLSADPEGPSEATKETQDENRSKGVADPTNPGELLVNTIQSLVDGLSMFGMELTRAFPELERNITNVQQQIPGQVDHVVRGAIEGLGNHMGNLAASMHIASGVARQAAERTREVDLRAVDGAAEGLRGFVDGIGDMGKTLFSAFETELSGNYKHTTTNTEPPASAAAPKSPLSFSSPPVDEKPYKCKWAGCSLTFTSPTLLAGHKRVHQHHGQFQCEHYCGRLFFRKDVCDRHMSEMCHLRPKETDDAPPVPNAGEQELAEAQAKDNNSPSTSQPQPTAFKAIVPGDAFVYDPELKMWVNKKDLNSGIRRIHRNDPYGLYNDTEVPPPFVPGPAADNRSRSPVSHPNETADAPRSGRSRSPPSQRCFPTMSGYQRRGPGWTHRRHDDPFEHIHGHARRPYGPTHHFPPIYDHFAGAVGGQSGPVDVPLSHHHHHHRAPPPPRHQPWAVPAQKPVYRPIRQRRSWYPGFRPDNNVAEPAQKPSVMFTRPVNNSDVVKLEPSRARRVRSVGTLHTKPDAAMNALSPESLRPNEVQQQTNSSNTILDQDVADPTFSVRYPSLMANKDLRRANTTGSTLGKGSDISAHHFNHSGMPPLSPDSEMVRFPTLSQFEELSHKDHLKSKKPDEFMSPNIPGSWPPQSGPNAETSGQFFTRMTGRQVRPTDKPVPEPAKSQLSRSNTVTASNPAARLNGPFDPLSKPLTTTEEESCHCCRTRKKNCDGLKPTCSRCRDLELTCWYTGTGLKRSATDRVSGRPDFNGNRRPYSEHFSGDGRLGWESFLQQYEKTPGSFPTTSNEETESQHHVPALPKSEPQQTRPRRPVLRVDTQPVVRRPVGVNERAEQLRPAKPVTMEQDSSVERCVSNLKKLGFGSKEDGGVERLDLYAQAAEGNLGDAIEMIEEERRAYKERGGTGV